jgi:thiazole tautomerase (transcriptional regulator TenI)
MSAASDGADYAFVGNVYETQSHPGRAGIGPMGLRAVTRTVGAIPVFGIGGVGVAAVRSMTEAGAYGVAVLSGVWDAPDPATAVSEYLTSLSRSGGRAGTTTSTADDREGGDS